MSGFAETGMKAGVLKKGAGPVEQMRHVASSMRPADGSPQSDMSSQSGSFKSASGSRASFRSRRRSNLLGAGYEPEEMK